LTASVSAAVLAGRASAVIPVASINAVSSATAPTISLRPLLRRAIGRTNDGLPPKLSAAFSIYSALVVAVTTTGGDCHHLFLVEKLIASRETFC
jgi:hypothetical protein